MFLAPPLGCAWSDFVIPRVPEGRQEAGATASDDHSTSSIFYIPDRFVAREGETSDAFELEPGLQLPTSGVEAESARVLSRLEWLTRRLSLPGDVKGPGPIEGPAVDSHIVVARLLDFYSPSERKFFLKFRVPGNDTR